ncbi:macro domain-containing protein [Sphingomonas alpina]|uniref:Macro domain-containing protein n=1 Tax=Sphingomonas alpina TaxID=653931 RepID=A0A7H0LJX2_9SPHN|nr:macro domain-containing protein [Sphingomonas alpina]QNQ09975.1 macro domain-containing protein [Sphingomonas alpina]
MHTVRGDLLALACEGEFDVIVHGCNCQCQMGKGIALAIKRQFPAAYAADLETEKGSREKLGSFSAAKVEQDGHSFIIVNAYTQFHWRGAGMKADYDAIRHVMRAIALQFRDCRIGYPKIGAGLAGGDWSVISAIIDSELDGLNHTYVEFSP